MTEPAFQNIAEAWGVWMTDRWENTPSEPVTGRAAAAEFAIIEMQATGPADLAKKLRLALWCSSGRSPVVSCIALYGAPPPDVAAGALENDLTADLILNVIQTLEEQAGQERRTAA